MYARTFFEELDIDSVTVAPYMGEDSVTPFLTYEGKWVILLALTSNKGSHDFQLTEDANGERLFEKVLRKSQDEKFVPPQNDGLRCIGSNKKDQDVFKKVPVIF